MKSLFIEVYFYSEKLEVKYGVYKSIYDESFSLLAIVYAIDDNESVVIDIASGEKISKELISALCDNKIIKKTYNSEITRTAIAKFTNMKLSVEGWISAVDIQQYIGIKKIKDNFLNKDRIKNKYETIDYFCNNYTRNIKEENPIKWSRFLKDIKKDFWNKKMLIERINGYEMDKHYVDYLLNKQRLNLKGVEMNEWALRQMVNKEHWDAVEFMTHICMSFGIDNVGLLKKAMKQKIQLSTLPEKMPYTAEQLEQYKEKLEEIRIFKYKTLYHRICVNGYIYEWDRDMYDIQELYKTYYLMHKNVMGVSLLDLKRSLIAWVIGKDFSEDTDKMFELKQNDFIEELYRAFCFVDLSKQKVKIKNLELCYEKDNIIVKLPSGRKILFISLKVDKTRSSTKELSYIVVDHKGEYVRLKNNVEKIFNSIISYIEEDINAYFVSLLHRNKVKVRENANNKIFMEFKDNDQVIRIKKLIYDNKPLWMNDLSLNLEWFYCMEVDTEDEIREYVD